MRKHSPRLFAALVVLALLPRAVGSDENAAIEKRLADSAKALAGVYKEIDEELRSQYLLTYVPPARKGDKWRKVEVKVSPGDLEARTISGYYP